MSINKKECMLISVVEKAKDRKQLREIKQGEGFGVSNEN